MRAHLRVVHRRFFLAAVIIAALIAVVGASPTGEHQPAVQAIKEPPRTIKVAAVGDSNTFGQGVSDEERATKSYPAQLQAKLGDKYEVKNYGISARAAIKTSDKPYDQEPVYTESKDYQPDIVLIMLGTNDSKAVNWNAESYRNDMISLIESYKSLESQPVVYVLTVPALVLTQVNKDTDIDGYVAINQVVPMIREIAAETHSPLIDIYSATKDRTDLILDGVHPNAEGLGIIADTVYKAIR